MTTRSRQAEAQSAQDAYVFVAGPSGIEEFAPGATKPLRRFASNINAQFLAMDHNGLLYAVGSEKTSLTPSFVEIFAPKSRSLIGTISLLGAETMAFDSSNNLYLATGGFLVGCPAKNVAPGSISAFRPGHTKPARIVRLGDVRHVWSLATDAGNDLFASTADLTGGTTCPPKFVESNASVAVYDTKTLRVSRTLRGIYSNSLPAVSSDSSGRSYVESIKNSLSCEKSTSRCTRLLAYAPGARLPGRVLQFHYSLGLAVGPNNDPYVLTPNPTADYCTVTEYAAGLSKMLQTFKVENCFDPWGPYFDQSNDIYVFNFRNTVFEFNANGKLMRAIPAVNATSIAIGPR